MSRYAHCRVTDLKGRQQRYKQKIFPCDQRKCASLKYCTTQLQMDGPYYIVCSNGDMNWTGLLSMFPSHFRYLVFTVKNNLKSPALSNAVSDLHIMNEPIHPCGVSRMGNDMQ